MTLISPSATPNEPARAETARRETAREQTAPVDNAAVFGLTSAAPRLAIDVLTTEGVAFLSVAGDVDVATADQLRLAGEQALSALTGTLRIDLAGVAFMDSTGLGALVAINNAARTRHKVLVLENPRVQVRRILQISGLAQVFTIS